VIPGGQGGGPSPPATIRPQHQTPSPCPLTRGERVSAVTVFGTGGTEPSGPDDRWGMEARTARLTVVEVCSAFATPEPRSTRRINEAGAGAVAWHERAGPARARIAGGTSTKADATLGEAACRSTPPNWQSGGGCRPTPRCIAIMSRRACAASGRRRAGRRPGQAVKPAAVIDALCNITWLREGRERAGVPRTNCAGSLIPRSAGFPTRLCPR